jgi:hypothetical protein
MNASPHTAFVYTEELASITKQLFLNNFNAKVQLAMLNDPKKTNIMSISKILHISQ